MRNSMRVIVIGMIVLMGVSLVPISQAAMPTRQGTDCGVGDLLFFQEQNGIDEIWRLTINGASEPALFVALDDQTVSATTPAWFYPAQQLAFTGTNASGYQDVYIVQVDSNGNTSFLATSTDLFDLESRERQPAWSVDGSMLAFAADSRSANFDIWVINTDKTGLTQLTQTETINEFSPTWSPDGSQLAYVSDENGFDQIQIINRQTLEKRSLREFFPADNFSPVWSPNMDWIAFTQREEIGSRIYLGNVLDGRLVSLTPIDDRTQINEAWPAWSHDGRYLAFAAPALDGSFDLYTVRVFDDTGNLLAPVVLSGICKVSSDTLSTSDEFGPYWVQ